MKIREGFILTDVAGKTYVVATGSLSHEFQAMITLNETAKVIWECLEKGAEKEEIVDKLMTDFEDAPKDLVERDVESFINKLIEEKIVE